ncbi:MAG TPA: PEP-CTERM sorting domain-containing protein [Tepidisphaeraceae bacterium]|nr:PEP-CTERM sorting domain-containing protein [Tepidisphaeraceae bacterium]
MPHRISTPLVGVLAVLAGGSGALAQVSFQLGSTYTQDFNTLPKPGDSPENPRWINPPDAIQDNKPVTLPDWFSVRVGSFDPQHPNFGSNETDTRIQVWRGSAGLSGNMVGLISFGTVNEVVVPNVGTFYTRNDGDTENALGAVPTGSRTMHYGLWLTNTGNVPLVSVNVKYDGEMYRRGNANDPGEIPHIEFAYALTNETPVADNTTDPENSDIFNSPLIKHTYTDVPSLDFIATNLAGYDLAALGSNTNGNSDPYRMEIADDINFALTSGQLWMPGQHLFLRWRHSNENGNDGLAIDNLVVSGAAVPEPGALAALSLVGLAGLRRRRV